MDGNIFNSQGVKVAIVSGPSIFSLGGKKLYDLRGINIYRLSGELVGHLANESASGRRLDKATDKLFSAVVYSLCSRANRNVPYRKKTNDRRKIQTAKGRRQGLLAKRQCRQGLRYRNELVGRHRQMGQSQRTGYSA